MRLLPFTVVLLALAPLARGQDPTPTPAPLAPQVFPKLPSFSGAGTPKVSEVAVSPVAAPQGLRSAQVDPVKVGQAGSLQIQAPTPASIQGLVRSMSLNGTLGASLSSVTPANLHALLVSVAKSPETAQMLLQAVSSNNQLSALLGDVQLRLEKAQLSDTLEQVDGDVLVAISQFASRDPRFERIAGYSHYGRQLAQVQEQIKAQGMTPENKAALLQVYRDATQALDDFLKAETHDE